MSFAPNYPENMPNGVVEAIERIHRDLDKKEGSSWAAICFAHEKDTLSSIAESVEVAVALAHGFTQLTTKACVGGMFE